MIKIYNLCNKRAYMMNDNLFILILVKVKFQTIEPNNIITWRLNYIYMLNVVRPIHLRQCVVYVKALG